MKIVCLKGGLGNQLFEYCRYRQLADSGEWESVSLFRDQRRLGTHGGCQLEACFDLTLPPCPLRARLVTWALKVCRKVGILRRLYDDEHDERRAILIDDYAQHRRFIDRANELLHFRDFSQWDEVTEWCQRIKSQPLPVALHVRRGDYLQADNLASFGLCPLSYYAAAVVRMRRLGVKPCFFVFSDDLAWAREHLTMLHDGEVFFVGNDSGRPDYTDLYLMSLCQAHIIANSTFSFWGARLAKQSRLVTYPQCWYADDSWGRPDIFPPEWEAL